MFHDPPLNPTRLSTGAATATMDTGLRRYMLGIYNYMGLALVTSGVVAWTAAQSQPFVNAAFVMQDGRLAGLQPLGWGLAFAPLVFAMVLGFGLQRLSLFAAQAAFWLFAAVMGLSLTTIVLGYTATSIASVFFITAATFGAISLYGYTTRRDLTKLGSFLMMAVLGLIIAAVVNMLLQSSILHMALSALGVLVFTALTAYDTQRLKMLYETGELSGDGRDKVMIIGALSLYINFINIFTSLMNLFGERR